MARSFSTAQEDVLNSKKYDVYTLLEVEDSTGAFIDIGTLGGANWFQGARWDWSIDQPVPEITLQVRRDQGPSTGESLAPLDEDSTFNRNAASAYAPLLDVGREIRFYTAAVAPGSAAPATSELDWVFQGEIDTVKWPKSPIEVVARTLIMSRLNDQWIETVTNYGSGAGVAIETVMQSILDDHTDLGITLSVPISPGFNISPEYEQQKENVLDALTTLAQLIGWQIREVFSSTEWVLELSEPRRTATSSETDWIFGADDYYDVQAMELGRSDVRNAVSVLFGPTSSRGSVLVESTASIDNFGRRWMEIEEGVNSAVDTSSEAATLANSVLSDLDEPPARHEIEVPYWWPGELGDYYEFEANGIHYSVDQFFGVYGLSHILERTRHRTVVRVRGQPAGQYLAWQRYPGGGGLPDDLTVTIVDKRLVPVESTEPNESHFNYQFDLQPGRDSQSLKVTYQWNEAGTSGYSLPFPLVGDIVQYRIDDVTPETVVTHNILTSQGGSDRLFKVFFDAASSGLGGGSPLPDLITTVSFLPFALPGASSGGGISPKSPRVAGDAVIVGDNADVGMRVIQQDSTGLTLSGFALVEGSTNVLFTPTTDGTIVLTVTT